jgi:SAM-dependent methyltransferase
MNDAPNFNRLARLYRWMEWLSFGPWLALTRRNFLPEALHARRALVLGDGDGRFTARLLRLNPEIQVDAVDASSAMLEELLRRAGPNASRVRVYLADARDWQPPAPIDAEPYDLIATHFFLDCLTQHDVRMLATTVASAADGSALWIVSEFAIPEGRFGALVAGPLVSLLYWAFSRLTGLSVRTLPDHSAALQSVGFMQVQRHARLGGLLISELWSIRPAGLFP